MHHPGYGLRRTPLLGTWVNSPVEMHRASSCDMLRGASSREHMQGKAVRRASPSTPHSCRGRLPDRVRHSSHGGWLFRSALRSPAEGGARPHRSHQGARRKLIRSSIIRRSPLQPDAHLQDKSGVYGVYTTNDVPGCPSGGLLSGTDKPDKLDRQDGEDKVRGLGDEDELMGGMGSDVIYGGLGDDSLRGGTVENFVKDVGDDVSKDVLRGGPGQDWIDGQKGDDVIYGGDGNDRYIFGGAGEDVIYGGDGNDTIISADGNRDKIYCGEGWDRYEADKVDHVSSSCEKEWAVPGPPGALADSPGPERPGLVLEGHGA